MMITGTARSVVVCVCLCQHPATHLGQRTARGGEVVRLLMVDVNNDVLDLTDLL